MTSKAAARGRGPGILRTFLWPILNVAMLTTATAVGVLAMQEPAYVSTGSVLVSPDRQGGALVLPQMGTERAVANSAEVAARAAESLGLSPEAASSHLEVTVPVDANVLDFSYSAADAGEAVAGAEAFTQAYVEFRNRDLKTPLAQVITEPKRPHAASPPNYAVAAVLALLVGLGLGFAAAFTWDRLRGRLRGPADAARVTRAQVLASVPARAQVRAPLATGAEVFGHLAARMSNLIGDRRRRVSIMVTAPRRGAGATTVAANLAVALDDLGREVVLVSGNLRRPDLHRVMGLKRAPGVTDVLRGRCGLAEAVQYTSRPNLRVLTAGSSTGSPHVDVDEYRALLAQLSRDAIVVVDAGPVLEVPETVLVGDACDLTVLVVDVRAGDRTDAAVAADTLRGLRGRLAGIVANRPGSSRRIQAGGSSGSPGAEAEPPASAAERTARTAAVTATGSAERADAARRVAAAERTDLTARTYLTARTGADRDDARNASS